MSLEPPDEFTASDRIVVALIIVALVLVVLFAGVSACVFVQNHISELRGG